MLSRIAAICMGVVETTCRVMRKLMKRRLSLSLLFGLGVVMPFASCVAAQPSAPHSSVQPQQNKPAPYDNQMARLSEILGAVQYLRTLCPATGSEEWRKAMSDLLAADTANEPQRKQRMTAAFNRGYRTFAAVHTTCTPAAIAAEEKYRIEGATLAQEIASRFGN